MANSPVPESLAGTDFPVKRTAGNQLPGDQKTTFRGVRKRSWGRYVSEIREPKKKTRIWLGSFLSPEMAARAYDSAAFFLKGNKSALNFPELAEFLPRPASNSRRDIQAAALKAANEIFVAESFGEIEDERVEEIDLGFSRNFGDVLSLEFDGELMDFFERVADAPLMSPLRIEAEGQGNFGTFTTEFYF
ncbi:ethylene-responsive transcription factor ERF039 [Amborella trichopoda]|uniref:AP2/ERF domain-containing protein n=1 Tax=Amborella trichopoda TaxID=13333 RepID=W1NYJ0_AMBTC|nr:ethylene-responsive transcription factor ERF039 [Amborella trichopoda]ERM99749.1 hypothetical protein AMTR_s00099p00122430 [Amborella trichopoda]|eukprot:XP_020519047.1 ethylene-responsive transcription factor ERF039 [Amborella trichopoda]